MDQGLASWFAIWHPRYRRTLAGLMAAALLASGLVYAEGALLGLLTQSLADGTARPEGLIAALLADASARLQVALPFLALGLFVAVRLLAAGISYGRTSAAGRLTIRTKDDVEGEVLLHLLQKDDAFFGRHSPAETVNRLAGDLYRVSQRRPNLVQAAWSALLLAGYLAFFLVRDWRLALVALGACAAGALWPLRMTRPVKEMDADYLRQDDRVKSRFEDFLRAAPEIQVGRLYQAIRRRFENLQADRTGTYLRYVRLSAVLRVGDAVSALLAFVAMIAVVLYLRGTGSESRGLALVPVVVWALPNLFAHASALVFLNLEFQLAGTSMARLLEYESQEAIPAAAAPGEEPAAAPGAAAAAAGARAPAEAAAARPDAGRAEPLRVENVTYRYAGPDGTEHGGIADVTARFDPGRWTAIVGGAGSGKSTLLKLLLGRLQPRAGRILYGETPLEAVPEPLRASLFSVMPQAAALLDATILENLLFGRRGAAAGRADPEDLSDSDMEILERSGLAAVCRLKALDRLPGKAAAGSDLARRVPEVRARLRERLRRAGITVRPYEDGHADPRHWVLEALLRGRCDRNRAVAILLGKAAARDLKPLLGTDLGARLAETGRGVLRESAQLLRLPQFHVYRQLAAVPLDERLWRLRSSHVHLADGAAASAKESVALCTIALTAIPAEVPADRPPPADDGGRFAPEVARLRALVGDACEPLHAGRVHPHLAWRENLLFAIVDAATSRAERTVDQAILEFLQEEGLAEAFTRPGLEYDVGRLGANLSGGQGQLVALGRAILRRTPVLVLDEPTSSLDPAGRAKVADLLTAWKAGRIVITVSHDPEFIREADAIHVMDGGRMAAVGTFRELKAGSDLFRRTLRRP